MVTKLNKKKTAKRSIKKSKNSKKKSNKIKTIIVEKKMSDDYIKSKEGEYFDEKHYDIVVDYDCGYYHVPSNYRFSCEML